MAETAREAATRAGGNLRAVLPYADLREWLAEAEKLGEVTVAKGLGKEEEIGQAAELVMHSDEANCVVFDEIPGPRAGLPRAGQFLRRQTQEHDARLPDRPLQDRAQRGLLRRPAQGPDPDPVCHGRGRPGRRERVRGRRRGPRPVPRAVLAPRRRRPLYRHRQLRRHGRSRHRLDEPRHLPGDGAGREDRRLLHLARQARAGAPRQIPRARRDDADG